MDYTNQLSESFKKINIIHYLWIILGVLILLICNYAVVITNEYAFCFALLILLLMTWIISLRNQKDETNVKDCKTKHWSLQLWLYDNDINIYSRHNAAKLVRTLKNEICKCMISITKMFVH